MKHGKTGTIFVCEVSRFTLHLNKAAEREQSKSFMLNTYIAFINPLFLLESPRCKSSAHFAPLKRFHGESTHDWINRETKVQQQVSSHSSSSVHRMHNWSNVCIYSNSCLRSNFAKAVAAVAHISKAATSLCCVIRRITVADDGCFAVGFTNMRVDSNLCIITNGFRLVVPPPHLPADLRTYPCILHRLIVLKTQPHTEENTQTNAGDKQRTRQPTNRNTRISFVETFPWHLCTHTPFAQTVKYLFYGIHI